MKELFRIFYTFFGIGALTFGGGYTMLPLFQKKIAEQRGWASQEEIMDFYAVSQCLPGIIAVNTAMQIGYKQKKIPGLIAAALGMAAPSVLAILIIAAFIQQFMEIGWVRSAFNGIRLAVLALITEAVITMWKNGVKDKAGIIIFVAAFALFTFVDVTPIFPLVAGAACGIIIKERKNIFKSRKRGKDNEDA